jgi:hypothetical protein
MFRELWSRWTYVELIKAVTLDKSGESFPFPSAEELAHAFNLYPHRREVPFILARMSRLLAFDDETSNYNAYISRFLQRVAVDALVARYGSRRALERYDGAIDPIVYISRIIVDAGRGDRKALADAIQLLRKHRETDGVAIFSRLIHEHELYEQENNPDKLRKLQLQIGKFLDGIKSHESPRTHIEQITSDQFQELLDHYAQLHIEMATADGVVGREDSINRIVQLYSRILPLRRQIANASEVPWLHGPGKLSLYHYFKHKVGRESNITRSVLELMNRVPGLTEAMDQRIFSAEAFKEFRSLEIWEKGTPLSASFSGKGMNGKLMEWLKTGW